MVIISDVPIFRIFTVFKEKITKSQPSCHFTDSAEPLPLYKVILI